MVKKINIVFSLLVFAMFSVYPVNYIQAYNINWTNYCFPTWDGDWILDSNLDGLNCEYPRNIRYQYCYWKTVTIGWGSFFSFSYNIYVCDGESYIKWPIKVYGDIYVGKNWNFTINISDWVTMWIDLSNNKIEFKDNNWNVSWKIKLNWTAVIKDVSNGKKYYISKKYITNGITSCPSWTVVLNTTRTAVLTKWNEEVVPSEWYMYCARIWPNSSKYNCYTQNGAIVCENR